MQEREIITKRDELKRLQINKIVCTVCLSNKREYTGTFNWISSCNSDMDCLIYFNDFKNNQVIFMLSDVVDISIRNGGSR